MPLHYYQTYLKKLLNLNNTQLMSIICAYDYSNFKVWLVEVMLYLLLVIIYVGHPVCITKWRI